MSSTRVYRMGLGAPIEGVEVVEQQLDRSYEYKKGLTIVEQGRRAAVREALLALPDVAEAYETAKIADEECAEVARALKTKRASTRSRSETGEDKEELLELRRARNAAFDCFSSTCSAAMRHADEKKGTPAGPLRARVDEIEELANVLRLNGRHHSGLAWGTYQAIEAAVGQARKTTPLFRGITPKSPRWRHKSDATRQLAVHFQTKVPSTASLFDGTNTWASIVPSPPRPARVAKSRGNGPGQVAGERPAQERAPEHCKLLRLQIGKEQGARFATWPLRLHRPLPRDGKVTWVQVNVRRIGPREEWYVCVTVAADEAAHEATKGRPDRLASFARAHGSVGLDIGWRQMPDGSVRVATYVGCDGRVDDLRLPPELISSIAKAEELQRVRDLAFNSTRNVLVGWLASHPVPQWLSDRTRTLGAWRSQGRLAGVVSHWSRNRFEGDEGIFGERALFERPSSSRSGTRVEVRAPRGLVGWASHDRHLWQWQSDQRTSALRRRDQYYQLFALWLRSQYAELRLEKFDLRDVIEREELDEEAANETANYNRVKAALSALRDALLSVYGERHVKLPAANTTRRCAECGTLNRWDQAAELRHTCTGCGAEWDQDENAARNLVGIEGSGGGAGAGGARGGDKASDSGEVRLSKWEKLKRRKARRSAS